MIFHINKKQWLQIGRTSGWVLAKTTAPSFPNRQEDLMCPECGGKMLFVPNGKYGPYYACEHYPECRVTHGARKDGSPAGTIGDLETIALRKAAHKKFDALWRNEPNPVEARTYWYKWLARKLSIPLHECHMAKFDKSTLRQVIGLMEYINNKKNEEADDSQPSLF